MKNLLKWLTKMIRRHGAYVVVESYTDMDELRFYLKFNPKTPKGHADKKYMLKKLVANLNKDRLAYREAADNFDRAFHLTDLELTKLG